MWGVGIGAQVFLLQALYIPMLWTPPRHCLLPFELHSTCMCGKEEAECVVCLRFVTRLSLSSKPQGHWQNAQLVPGTSHAQVSDGPFASGQGRCQVDCAKGRRETFCAPCERRWRLSSSCRVLQYYIVTSTRDRPRSAAEAAGPLPGHPGPPERKPA